MVVVVHAVLGECVGELVGVFVEFGICVLVGVEDQCCCVWVQLCVAC